MQTASERQNTDDESSFALPAITSKADLDSDERCHQLAITTNLCLIHFSGWSSNVYGSSACDLSREESEVQNGAVTC